MKGSNISKKYGKKNVLCGIDFDWTKCGLVFIYGESGSGKSTLLNILGGIDESDEGNIYDSVDGQGNNEKDITFVFQEKNLLDSWTVADNLRYSMRMCGRTDEGIEDVIEKLGIQELFEQKVNTLSGGEKQRVAIARAVLTGHRTVLADEPTGNLDEQNAESCFQLLKEISKDRLVVVVSHDLRLASKYADCIYQMENGLLRLVEDGTYHNNQELPGIEKRQKLHWVRSYSHTYLKCNHRRMLPVIILMTIVLLAVMISMGIYSALKTTMNFVNRTQLENDYFYAENEDFSNIDMSKQEAINLVRGNNVLEQYAYMNVPLQFYSSIERAGICPELMEDNGFFEERFTDVIGQLPKDGREIMINANMAKFMFATEDYASCIGKVLYLDYGNVWSPNTIEFTVVGIRQREENSESEYRMFMLEDTHEEVCRLLAGWGSIAINALLSTSFSDISSIDELLYGEKAENSNEVVVSLQLAKELYCNIHEQDLSSEIGDEVKQIVGMSVTIKNDCTSEKDEKVVVGISTGTTNCCFLYQWSQEDEADKFNRIDMYLNSIDDQKIETLRGALAPYGLFMATDSQHTTRTISSYMILLLAAMSLVILILLVITFLVLRFWVKQYVAEREYETGVLRVLGATKAQVLYCVEYNVFCISGISVLLTIVINGILSISRVWDKLTIIAMPVYEFELWHIVLVVMVGLVVPFLVCCRNIHKLVQKQLVDIFRIGRG